MTTTRRYLRNESPIHSRIPVDSWREHAACLRHPTVPASAWDDHLDGQWEDAGARHRRIAPALAVCAVECPVRDACRADVDILRDRGVRGGRDLRQVRAGKTA